MEKLLRLQEIGRLHKTLSREQRRVLLRCLVIAAVRWGAMNGFTQRVLLGSPTQVDI